MQSLSIIIQANGLSMGAAARIADVDKSTISKIISKTYPGWEKKEQEVIAALVEKGYTKTTSEFFSVNTDVMVKTSSVSRFFDLADDLSDPLSSMSSSIGMAIGTAERGKTHAAKNYADKNDQAVYTLYVDGFTRVQLLRNICYELTGGRPFTFGACLSVISEVAAISRRVVIIDEADKCPLPILEMLRGLNEACVLPILLVGEEALKSKMESIPRLRSRIRKPICVFDSLSLTDVSTYYSTACGLSLDREIITSLHKRSHGGFRSLVNDSLALAKIARVSGNNTVTPVMLEKLSV